MSAENFDTQATAAPTPPSEAAGSNELESLLNRINRLASGEQPSESASATAHVATPIPQPPPSITPPATAPPTQEVHPAFRAEQQQQQRQQPPAETEESQWQPAEPASLEKAGISGGQLEHLALRCLSAVGDMSGHQLAEQHAVPFRLIEPILADLKQAQLVAYRGSAAMNDYIYQLTDMGRETAKKLTELCSYFGAAPVPLWAYIESVKRTNLNEGPPHRRKSGGRIL